MRWLPVAALVVLVATGGIATANPVDQMAGESVEAGLSTGGGLDGSPASETLSSDSATTVRFVVEGAASGIGSADIDFAVSNTSVARIENVTLVGNGTVTDTSVASNGSSAEASAVGLSQTGESVVVAEATVRAAGTGTAEMTVSVGSLGDRDGQAYDVTVTDGSVDVTVGGDGESQGSSDGADGDTGENDDSGSSLPLVPGLGALVVVIAGLVLYRRR